MNDRERRKRDEQRRQRKAQHAENRRAKSAIHPDDIVPLEIDGSVNLYDAMKEGRMGEGKLRDIRDLIFQGIDIDEYLKKIDLTLEHFKVPLEKWSATGNVLIRFSALYANQPDGKKFQISADDPALNYIADLWEYFNKLWG